MVLMDGWGILCKVGFMKDILLCGDGGGDFVFVLVFEVNEFHGLDFELLSSILF